MIGVVRIMLAAVAAVALIAACSTSHAPPPPPQVAPIAITQGALCDSLLSFFSDELHAVGLVSVPVVDLNTTLSGTGGICTAINGESQRANGRIFVRNAPNVSDPTEGGYGFTKTTELNETVWLQDMRVDTRNPGPEVVLATRIGDWNGQLRITDSQTRTASGVLHLTDQEIHTAAQFLIELTRKLSKA